MVRDGWPYLIPDNVELVHRCPAMPTGAVAVGYLEPPLPALQAAVRSARKQVKGGPTSGSRSRSIVVPVCVSRELRKYVSWARAGAVTRMRSTSNGPTGATAHSGWAEPKSSA
jgi:hypothetical protein